MNGSNSREGRVEICLSNGWATVCDQMWDNTDAGVVCRQIGLATSGIEPVIIVSPALSLVEL